MTICDNGHAQICYDEESFVGQKINCPVCELRLEMDDVAKKLEEAQKIIEEYENA